MPRAVFATLAIFVINFGLCLGQQVPLAVNDRQSNQPQAQPIPQTVSAEPSPAPSEDLAAERTLLELANMRRSEAGAPPLRLEPALTDAARAHARLMVKRQQLSHHFDDEPTLMPRLLQTGLRLDHVGENVAFNSSAEKAFDALMESPLHRRNLLNPDYNSAGFAAFWSDRRLYVVQDFAHRVPVVTQTSLP
ncbi:MAG: CAP domain-containing protein [Terriglobales bacterium]|jgi:uncharacterized protein YkwD